jgi:5-methylcytosine-specific restriction endonuclease McrA
MTRSSKPDAPTRPKLATLGQRVGLADLSIAGSVQARTDASWRGSTKSSRERGYTWKWEKARKRFLQAHPLCCYCEREGRVTAATVVDHKIPHRGDMKIFWDESGWQALCVAHHSGAKQREENRDGR